jgi:hypothetical protein
VRERLFVDAANALVILTAVLSTVFVAYYQKVADWWRSEAGWHLMSFSASLMALFDLAVLRIFWGGAYWFEWVRLALFVALPLNFAWRIRLLYRAQHEPEMDERPPA